LSSAKIFSPPTVEVHRQELAGHAVSEDKLQTHWHRSPAGGDGTLDVADVFGEQAVRDNVREGVACGTGTLLYRGSSGGRDWGESQLRQTHMPHTGDL